jgi:hypothetical protein
MAIKATKQGEEPRWIVFSLFDNAGDYEKSVIQHSKEGWNLEHGFDYADVISLWGQRNLKEAKPVIGSPAHPVYAEGGLLHRKMLGM